MRIAWVTRSFLDYRVPVFAAVDALVQGGLHVVYASDYVPDRVRSKIEHVLGNRAIGLSGEWKLGSHDNASWANSKPSLRYHPDLLKSIRGCQPDVLIGDGFFKWTLGLMAYKALYSKPLVVCYERTCHTERTVQWYRNIYRRMVARMIDAMCCSGRLCGEYAKSLGFPAERMTYGHMVADVEGLRAGSAEISEAEIRTTIAEYELHGVVFLYVGQLVPRKGVEELLEGWRRLRASGYSRQATLLLVGDGVQRVELEQFSRSHGLADVRFAGMVDYDKLSRFYRVADLFVMPTLEDNWSLVIPEAMACGLPVLCSKYNGCWPELVHPETNGWIFDPLDSQDCADKLRLCMESKENCAQFGRASLGIVERFTPDHAAKSILEACEMAVSRRSSASCK